MLPHRTEGLRNRAPEPLPAREFWVTLLPMKHSPGFLALVQEAKKNIRECTIAQVKERFDRGEKLQFVDVREDHEFAQDHATGARHIGRGVLERDVETLIPDRETPIVLYCGGGFRSALAADNLRKMGYRNVVSMDGGIRAWREAGYPIARG
jgi:rhodanese-related sulfurtransferase